jgi:ABC-type antimicrobial peptide transport system permease subunit
VRLALGAQPIQILTMVTRHGAILAGMGVIAGVAVAYAAGRWLESILAGVSPADPPAFAAAIAVAVVMTLAGSLMPAMRAARTDPRQAIQEN